ncbi:MAG: hypothetical protein GEU80_13410 [Dehalococcoidia bacterium]|nr:hypothetical protein [Dehalococcoidia bacterium]
MGFRRQRKRRWQDLSTGQRRGIAVAAAVQFALLAFALADLVRRPSRKVRGRKLLWLPVLFVNYFGPVAYLVAGRK